VGVTDGGNSVEISVQLRPEAGPADLDDLRARAEELGVELLPVHPGEDDPVLASFYTLVLPDDPDDERANSVLAALRESDAVDAAFVKPAAEPP
jgi:hypothetical protein